MYKIYTPDIDDMDIDDIEWENVYEYLEEYYPKNKMIEENDNSFLCKHPKKYKNVISKALTFWVCPDCKQEVNGD